MPGVPWHTQILADQLTLFQPGGTDYAHLITTGTPGFSDLPTALNYKWTSSLLCLGYKKTSPEITYKIFETGDFRKDLATLCLSNTVTPPPASLTRL